MKETFITILQMSSIKEQQRSTTLLETIKASTKTKETMPKLLTIRINFDDATYVSFRYFACIP